MNTNFLRSLLVLLLLSGSAFAQDVLPNKVYRVTAYKQGNVFVTSTSNYAEVIPPVSIYIPNAFTPNGDGLNDMFGVKGEGIRDYHLYIYNRWGEMIWESSNPHQQWDGKKDGRMAETGVYVYKLFAYGVPKGGKTGSVTLVY